MHTWLKGTQLGSSRALRQCCHDNLISCQAGMRVAPELLQSSTRTNERKSFALGNPAVRKECLDLERYVCLQEMLRHPPSSLPYWPYFEKDNVVSTLHFYCCSSSTQEYSTILEWNWRVDFSRLLFRATKTVSSTVYTDKTNYFVYSLPCSGTLK
jgi:hypothetical protein